AHSRDLPSFPTRRSSDLFREFMFHTVLANNGYVVLDMDYRASKGYGRDWRTAIYRQMGHPELEDFEDGVAWLVERYGVDRDRVRSEEHTSELQSRENLVC